LGLSDSLGFSASLGLSSSVNLALSSSNSLVNFEKNDMIAVILADGTRWVEGRKGFETDTNHDTFLYIVLGPLCPSMHGEWTHADPRLRVSVL